MPGTDRASFGPLRSFPMSLHAMHGERTGASIGSSISHPGSQGMFHGHMPTFYSSNGNSGDATVASEADAASHQRSPGARRVSIGAATGTSEDDDSNRSQTSSIASDALIQLASAANAASIRHGTGWAVAAGDAPVASSGSSTGTLVQGAAQTQPWNVLKAASVFAGNQPLQAGGGSSEGVCRGIATGGSYVSLLGAKRSRDIDTDKHDASGMASGPSMLHARESIGMGGGMGAGFPSTEIVHSGSTAVHGDSPTAAVTSAGSSRDDMSHVRHIARGGVHPVYAVGSSTEGIDETPHTGSDERSRGWTEVLNTNKKSRVSYSETKGRDRTTSGWDKQTHVAPTSGHTLLFGTD